MEAKEEDEIIEVLRSDYINQFKTGIMVGAIAGLTVMFLVYNLL
jgi:hypothetical protein